MSTRASAPRCASCGMPLAPESVSCAVCGARVPLIARPDAVRDRRDRASRGTPADPAAVPPPGAGPAPVPFGPAVRRRSVDPPPPPPPPSVGRRVVAQLTDLGVLLVGSGAAAGAAALVDAPPFVAVATTALLVLVLQVVAEGVLGATAGAAAAGLRTVTHATGAAPGVGRALVRQLVLAAGSLLPLVGTVLVAASAALDDGPDRRGWHDRASGTRVVDASAPRHARGPAGARSERTAAPGSGPSPVASGAGTPGTGSPRPAAGGAVPPSAPTTVALGAPVVPQERAAGPASATPAAPAPAGPDPSTPPHVPLPPGVPGPVVPDAVGPAPVGSGPLVPPRPVDPGPVRPHALDAHPLDAHPLDAHPLDPNPLDAPPVASRPVVPAPRTRDRGAAAPPAPDLPPLPVPAPGVPAPVGAAGVPSADPEDGTDPRPGPPAAALPVLHDELVELEHTRVRDPAQLRRRSTTLALQFDTGPRVRVVGRGLAGRGPRAEDGADILHVVAVDDPSRSVSRVHLEFGPQPPEGPDDAAAVWVLDRGSTNGSVVVAPGGEAHVLPPGTRAVVGAGWAVRIGERVVQVEDA